MATYNWIIEQLTCSPAQEGRDDVVISVTWLREISDGDGHSSYIFGVQDIALNPDASFTPYEDLTKDQVIGWLENSFGNHNLAIQEATLQAQLEEVVNPPAIVLPLPWAN